MIVHVLPSPRIALFVLSLPLAGHASAHVNSTLVPQIMSQSVLLAPYSDHRNPPVTCITVNNQLTPRLALPSAPSAHRSNPHS